MKTTGIVLSVLFTALFIVLGARLDPDYYLGAIVGAWVIFRLSTGSACPGIWLAQKLGARGLSCPVEKR